LLYELQKLGLLVERQKPIEVCYKEKQVGEYFADLIVENKAILELKAAESLCSEHELQLIHYLKATNIEIGLLLNFGQKPEIRRKIFSINGNLLNLCYLCAIKYESYFSSRP